jgi:hypothetical protein
MEDQWPVHQVYVYRVSVEDILNLEMIKLNNESSCAVQMSA